MGFDQKKSSQSQSSTNKTAEQRAMLASAIESFTPRIGQNRFYGGQTFAPMSDYQQQLFGTSQGFLDTFAPSRGIPLFNELQQTTGQLLRGDLNAPIISQDRANQLYQGSRVAPAQQQFTEFTQPLIREEYAGPGFFGSPRADAVTREAGRLGQSLEAGRNQFLTDIERQNQATALANAQLQASGVPLGAAVGQLPTQEGLARQQGMGNMFAFAGQEQAQRQAQLDDARNRFYEATAWMPPDDQAALFALLGLDFQSSSGRASSSSFGINTGNPMMGSAAGVTTGWFGTPTG